MDYAGMTPQLEKTFADLGEAGIDEGQSVKLLFSAPGFSLTYAWFKSAFRCPVTATTPIACIISFRVRCD